MRLSPALISLYDPELGNNHSIREMKQTMPYLPGYVLPQEGTALAAAAANIADSPTVETVLKAHHP